MFRTRLLSLLDRLLDAPLLVWGLSALALPYWLFFIQPIFFAPEGRMQFPEYVPALGYAGGDLEAIMRAPGLFLSGQQDPYTNDGQYTYPPFNMLLVAPLAPYSLATAYRLLTLINVACAVIIGFLLPWRLAQPRPIAPLLVVALLTGLFSYGFQFELERGQFNLIAMSLTFGAVWLYHTRPRRRSLAYGLFTLAVQLKVFPFIFFLLLIHDWRDWRGNIKRLLGLGAANFALLFVFGPAVFGRWLAALVDKTVNPYLWQGNHSIRSVVAGIAQRAGNEWLIPVGGPIKALLMALVLVCLGALLVQAYRRRWPGVNPFLFAVCTLAALTLPSDSHDYTLSYLVAPVALLFAQPDLWLTTLARRRRALQLTAFVAFTAAYGYTLFSYVYKPITVNNNGGPLLIMLVAVTAAALISVPPPALAVSPAPAEEPAA